MIETVPRLNLPADWDAFDLGPGRKILEEEALTPWLRGRRWFAGKARTLGRLEIVEWFPINTGSGAARIAFIRAAYAEGTDDLYFVPLQLATGAEATGILESSPGGAIALLGDTGLLYDAVEDADFRNALLEIMADGASSPAANGNLVGICGEKLVKPSSPLISRSLKMEQSNSAIFYGEQFFLKLYRRVEGGVNPDAELIRFLSERAEFRNVPAFLGALEFQSANSEPRALGLLAPQLSNVLDAWESTLQEAERFYRAVITVTAPGTTPRLALVENEAGAEFIASMGLLGQRTAEMHLALASDSADPAFAPEEFTESSQQTLFASMQAMSRRMLEMAGALSKITPEGTGESLRALPLLEAEIERRLATLTAHPIKATLTRTHGDYHLGQVLKTANDFIILDFEGEPARPLAERRRKQSPLRDVAGMLRSLHYAAYVGLWQRGNWSAEQHRLLEPWAEAWASLVGEAFLGAYLGATGGASFVPTDAADRRLLLDAHLLEKAAYEVVYELNNRPAWVVIPIRGIEGILRSVPQ